MGTNYWSWRWICWDIEVVPSGIKGFESSGWKMAHPAPPRSAFWETSSRLRYRLRTKHWSELGGRGVRNLIGRQSNIGQQARGRGSGTSLDRGIERGRGIGHWKIGYDIGYDRIGYEIGYDPLTNDQWNIGYELGYELGIDQGQQACERIVRC